MTEVDGVVSEYAQMAARVGGAPMEAGPARQRPARPAAASFAAAGRGVVVKSEVGCNATDKLVPEQRRQQDYRALGERAERISDGD
jgi:hypothetical protein